MQRCLSFAIIIFSSIFLLTGCSEKTEITPPQDFDNLTVTPSMKGWELYSWTEGNSLKFSFLVGTNRIKSLAEVTDANSAELLIRVTGTEAAKKILNKFPAGENVMLIGQGWLQNAWRAQYGNLQLPPQTVIDELKMLSNQKRLVFTVAN